MKKINLFLFLLPFLLFSIGVAAQTRTITGSITDAQTGEVLVGATVKILNSKIATATNEKGIFKIQIPASISKNVSLEISSVGYASLQLTPKEDNLVLKLVSANKQLNDVVVVGYGSAKKSTLTGSVASIKAREITEAPVTNVSNGLAGRLPGLVAVTSSGEPGSDGTTLRIRGSNTFNDNSVLVVVDGVPDRSLERIDPNSIESITILKDASAAIYGARAANGVILVTTKRGKQGKPEITYNTNIGYNQPTRLPKLVDAPTYATLLNEIAYYQNPSGGFNQTYKDAEIKKFSDGSDPLRYPNTDWFNTVLKPQSAQTSNNVTISGGTESMRYFVSLGTKHQDANYKNSGTFYDQYDFRSNVDGKITKDISFGFDVSGRLEDRHYPIKSAGNIFNSLVAAYPTMVAIWPNGLPGPAREHGENPVTTATGATGYNNDKYYAINSNLKLDVNIPWVKGLSLSANLSFDQGFDFDKVFEKPWKLYSWDKTTVDASGNPVLLSNTFGGGLNNTPQLNESFRSDYNKVAYGLLNYQTKFGENHNFKIMFGAQSSKGNSETFSAFRDLFASTAIQELFAGGTTNQSTWGTGSVNARASYFGRVNYNYSNKYLAEFVWRQDGSYIFPENNRWGFFPGGSVGWVASEENFWKKHIKFIDYFKLRASIGQTGNDRVSNFQYLTAYLLGNNYGYGNYPFVTNTSNVLTELQTLYENVVANPNITWEVANQANIGFDAGFLNNKLTVEADYFSYKRSNILWPQTATVPVSAGLNLPSVNYGKVVNKGFEFAINYKDVTASKLSYSISVNGGYAQNKVLQWGEAPGAPVWQQTTGHPMGSGLYYTAIGVLHNSTDSTNYNSAITQFDLSGTLPGASRPTSGDLVYADINKDGKIDGLDRQRIYKNNIPTFTFGSSINLSYKSFDLSVLIQGATGAVIYSSQDGGTFTNFRQSQIDGRWTPSNTTGDVPRTPNRGNYYWANTSNTFYLHKADYVRLKTLQVGYNISPKLLEKANIKSVRVYLSGYNLLTYSPDIKDFDPELGANTSANSSASGISGANYPIERVVSVGLTLKF